MCQLGSSKILIVVQNEEIFLGTVVSLKSERVLTTKLIKIVNQYYTISQAQLLSLKRFNQELVLIAQINQGRFYDIQSLFDAFTPISTVDFTKDFYRSFMLTELTHSSSDCLLAHTTYKSYYLRIFKVSSETRLCTFFKKLFLLEPLGNHSLFELNDKRLLVLGEVSLKKFQKFTSKILFNQGYKIVNINSSDNDDAVSKANEIKDYRIYGCQNLRYKVTSYKGTRDHQVMWTVNYENG